jgi:hypothetical protein
MDAALRTVGEEVVWNQEDPLLGWGVVLVVGQAPSERMPRTVCCVKMLPGANARFCPFDGPHTRVWSQRTNAWHFWFVLWYCMRRQWWAESVEVFLARPSHVFHVWWSEIAVSLVFTSLEEQYCSSRLRERDSCCCCCSFFCRNWLMQRARGVIQNRRVPGASSLVSGFHLLTVNWSARFINNEQKLINSVMQSPSWNVASSWAAFYWTWRFMSVFRRVPPFPYPEPD